MRYSLALIGFEAAGTSHANLMGRLRGLGIGTEDHYIPTHKQPSYQSTNTPDLHDVQSYYYMCLSLPLFPSAGDSDVGRACDTLASELNI